MNTTIEYNTTHDTANQTMLHEFEAGYAVLADFKNQKVITSRNGNVIENVSMQEIGTISAYERHLANVANAVEAVKNIIK